MIIPAGKRVWIDYTNHRGERSDRFIMPGQIKFTATEWHTEPQWILYAHDLLKDRMRGFALKDIHSWKPAD